MKFDDFALDGAGGVEETTFYSFPIDASHLAAGKNVLPLEVYQISGTSSDLSIDVRLRGTRVTETTAVPVTGQMEVNARAYDHST